MSSNLWKALCRKNFKAVCQALDEGADVNERGRYAQSPLGYAARKGCLFVFFVCLFVCLRLFHVAAFSQ